MKELIDIRTAKDQADRRNARRVLTCWALATALSLGAFYGWSRYEILKIKLATAEHTLAHWEGQVVELRVKEAECDELSASCDYLITVCSDFGGKLDALREDLARCEGKSPNAEHQRWAY